MLYCERLLVAKVIYDVYDATAYEMNHWVYSIGAVLELLLNLIT